MNNKIPYTSIKLLPKSIKIIDHIIFKKNLLKAYKQTNKKQKKIQIKIQIQIERGKGSNSAPFQYMLKFILISHLNIQFINIFLIESMSKKEETNLKIAIEPRVKQMMEQVSEKESVAEFWDVQDSQSEENNVQRRMRRRKKRQRKKNYFQQMFQEAKKNTNINLFLRKIKQNSLLTRLPDQLKNFEEDESMKYLLAIKWSENQSIAYSIIFILHAIAISIIASLIVAFPELQERSWNRGINIFTVLLLATDIIINFTSRISIDLHTLQKRNEKMKEIRDQYLKNYFLSDFLTLIIFIVDLAHSGTVTSILKMITLIRLWRIFEKIKNLEITIIENCFREQYWGLIKIFLWNFIFAHFLNCLLILMADEHENWLTSNGLMNSPWHTQYIWGYYWATTIMLTIGFGDLTPVSEKQVVCMIFIETFSCILLAYNINSVGNIIRTISSYEQEKVENLKIFTQMERKQEMTNDIKEKIRNYIVQSVQMKRKFNVEQERSLLEKIPKTFTDQYRKETNIKILSNIFFFRNLSIKKLQDIALRIEKKLTHPEEILIEAYSVPDIMIVNKGILSFTMNRVGLKSHGKEIQQMEVGDNDYKILSLYFFANKELKYDIRCKDFTIVYVLKKNDFLEALQHSPYCYEYYCMARDKDRCNPNDLQLINCNMCENKARHSHFDCPKMHYIPLKSLIVRKMQKENPQILQRMRKMAKRRKKSLSKNNHPLKIRQDLINIVLSDDFKWLLKKNKVPDSQIESISKFKVIIRSKSKEDIKKKSKFFQEESPVFDEHSIQNICKKFGEEIKDEVLKGAFGDDRGQIWDIQCDQVNNFKFYFLKDNADRLSIDFRHRSY